MIINILQLIPVGVRVLHHKKHYVFYTRPVHRNIICNFGYPLNSLCSPIRSKNSDYNVRSRGAIYFPRICFILTKIGFLYEV